MGEDQDGIDQIGTDLDGTDLDGIGQIGTDPGGIDLEINRAS